ncbi:MAG: molybdopterin-dependent oxidoreductase [Desulfovibrio sp.]|nr:molybdopterin-dependent oxidoreductase [Desulfovibrio sp.]
MGLNRRAFIQFSVGGTLGLLVTPVIWKTLDDVSIWTQNWGWIPTLKKGVEERVPAVSKLCPSGCALRVETVGGEPYSTTGDEDNPLSKGGLCPICADAVPLLYSPTRVQGPMVRTGEGQYQPVSWDEAKKLLAEKLGAAGSSVAVISGDDTGSGNEVFSALLAELGSDDYYMMPSPQMAATRAWNGLMGGEGQIGYDIAGSDFVLFAGADALSSWGPTVSNMNAFAESHPAGEKAKSTYVYAGPARNHTSSVCDSWVPVHPEGMSAFLLGLAYNLITEGRYLESGDFAALRSLLASKYSPAQVEKLTGVSKKSLAELAGKLLRASAPVVVADYGCSPAVAAAGIIVNLLLGRMNTWGGMVALPEVEPVLGSALDRPTRFAKDLPADVASGAFAPKVCLIYDANPVYGLPQYGEKIAEKAEFTVAFSTFKDETAAVADLVLPAAHPFERYDDLVNPFGVANTTYVASSPVVKPSLDVMGAPQFALDLAAEMGLDLGFENFEEVLEAKAEAAEAAVGTVGSYSVGLGLPALSDADKTSGQLALYAYSQLHIGSASMATTPHNPTTIRDTELQGKQMFVRINSETAKANGLKAGSKVRLSANGVECQALVHVDEGVMPGVVAAPLGFGHTAWDEFSMGKGGNVYKLLTVSAGSGGSAWTGSAVTIAKM